MLDIFHKIIHMDIRSTLVSVWQRFPLSTLIVIVLSGLWFYAVNIDESIEWVHRAIVTLIVVFFLATSLALAAEWHKWRYTPVVTYILPIVFGGFFYFTTVDLYDASTELVTYIVLTLSGFIAAVFSAPFLIWFITRREERVSHFYNYFVQIAWVFLMALVVGGSLMALGAIAIASVSALFDIVRNWSELDKLYGNWAVISLSIIAPLYALIQLPWASDYEKSSFEKNRFFSFLVRYVATPFIYIYFLILYAYTAKVLANFSDWPKGVVSWMVIGFSAFGYLIYIFSRAYEEESALTRIFRRYFPLLVLPQVCMLFYAIYLRIAQYDITMNRYFVVVFGIWLTLISIYYVVSQKRYLSVIPSSLVAIILIISVWPWSVYSFPLARQEARLLRNLETARILQNGNIVPLASAKDISRELSNDIASGIAYVCDFRHCDIIRELFPVQIAEATRIDEENWKKYNTETWATYEWLQKYSIASSVSAAIKVQLSYSYEGIEPKYLQFNTNRAWVYPLDITGYDQIVSVYGSGMGNDIPDKEGNRGLAYITIDADTNKLTYHRVGLADIVMTLPTRTDLTSESVLTGLETSDLMFSLTGETLDMMLYLEAYAMRNPDYTEKSSGEKQQQVYYNISGVALIREKR